MPTTETPSTNGENGSSDDFRDRRGRFLPGNPGGPGNPQARNVGAWRVALADAVSADDVTEVTQRLLDAAKAGKAWAIRELLDRCLGKPHVQIELQADTDHIREYSEAERIEGLRLSRLLLTDGEGSDAPGEPEGGDREQVTQEPIEAEQAD